MKISVWGSSNEWVVKPSRTSSGKGKNYIFRKNHASHMIFYSTVQHSSYSVSSEVRRYLPFLY